MLGGRKGMRGTLCGQATRDLRVAWSCFTCRRCRRDSSALIGSLPACSFLLLATIWQTQTSSGLCISPTFFPLWVIHTIPAGTGHTMYVHCTYTVRTLYVHCTSSARWDGWTKHGLSIYNYHLERVHKKG